MSLLLMLLPVITMLNRCVDDGVNDDVDGVSTAAAADCFDGCAGVAADVVDNKNDVFNKSFLFLFQLTVYKCLTPAITKLRDRVVL